ncbi:MAG: ABC transporter ATP-binding protein [Christensenellaceae bacterium]|jgi:oligopeptide transport system ATP-binding protein|nr:ABC transporter ATP-binding protein [Christensenellaceae bacterium]
MSLLEINHLSTHFKTAQGTVKALRDVSFRVSSGEVFGIVGESGSGKSVSMLSLMGLLAENSVIPEGEILFNGKDISPANLNTKRKRNEYEKKMRKLRGGEISMIFQDPMTFLNPVLKVGTQICEGILAHIHCSREEARIRAIELMRQVGIPSPEKRLDQYPFEFSGGMRQRIIIATALACKPKLIIADEPTTALDVTVQAQILELIKTLTDESGAAVVMITHDLGVVATLCDRIAILYAGRVMEEGLTEEIFYSPKHPYTKGLLGSINNSEKDESEPLQPIPGTPPDLLKLPAGCAFMPRCQEAMRICGAQEPPKSAFSGTHRCYCWRNSMDEALITVSAPAANTAALQPNLALSAAEEG